MSWRRFSAIRAVFWTALVPVAWSLGWLESIPFVNILSLIALIESAIAAWRADVPTERP